MKLYSYDHLEGYVIEHKVTKETKCFYFLDRDCDYSGRIYKDAIGVKIFKTPLEAIEDRVKKHKLFLTKAEQNLVACRIKYFDVNRWANKEKDKLINS